MLNATELTGLITIFFFCFKFAISVLAFLRFLVFVPYMIKVRACSICVEKQSEL